MNEKLKDPEKIIWDRSPNSIIPGSQTRILSNLMPPILCLAALTANESDIAALLRREIEEEKKPEPTNLKHVVFGIDATTKLWEQRKNYIKIWYKSDMMRGTVWMDGEVATTADDDLKKELDMWRRSLEGSDEEKC
ncbi:hypothetical protein LINPERPRIM_LOCUS14033 [Linum perenne]